MKRFFENNFPLMYRAVDYLFETLISKRTGKIEPCDHQIIETSLLRSPNKPCEFVMNMPNVSEFIIYSSKTSWLLVH